MQANPSLRALQALSAPYIIYSKGLPYPAGVVYLLYTTHPRAKASTWIPGEARFRNENSINQQLLVKVSCRFTQ